MLFEGLNNLPGLRAIPSQANFILVELAPWLDSTKVAEELLDKYEILIKDLSAKRPFKEHNFVRIAVRNNADNHYLLDALSECISKMV